MSYSRWGNSRWYTYDDAAGDGTLDGSIFTVCNNASFTYRDVKDDMDACVSTCLEKEPDATKHEQDELRGYMREWMSDVEAEFKDGNDNPFVKNG